MVELFNQTRTTHVTGRMMVVIITITRPGFDSEYQVKILRNGADEAFVMVKESDRLMTLQEALELHDEWVSEVKRHNRKPLKWQLRYAGHWTPLDEQMPEENMPVLVSDGSTWYLLSWMPDYDTGEVLWFNSDDVEIDLGDFTPLFWTEGPTQPYRLSVK